MRCHLMKLLPNMADDVPNDVCDSWEDMVENGMLDKKIEELHVVSTNKNRSEGSSDEVLSPAPQVMIEDSFRTQYAPPVPQVKILKRPMDAKQNNINSGDKSPSRQPIKTLQEREAEYAKARLRILGSACSEEDEAKEKPAALSLANLGSKPTPSESASIVRQPLGPDGTTGFVGRR